MRHFQMRPMKYQPIAVYSSSDEISIIGYEALYNSADNYKIFQGNNLDLERDCVLSAISEAVEHGLGLNPQCKLFVNASMNAVLKFKEELTEFTFKSLRPGQLVVEITELPFHGSITAIYKIINDIRSRGLLVAIDDFGAGQSYRLTNIEMDYIKVDMSTIRNCHQSLSKQRIIKQLVGLYGAEKLIAEGVESIYECDACRQIGVSIMQGYFIGYPAKLPVKL